MNFTNIDSYYEPYYSKDIELEHYGVKGMKWGVRRYQNKDRTRINSKRNKINYKKIAKIGMASTGSVLALYGAYKLYDNSIPKMITIQKVIQKQVPYQAVTHYRTTTLNGKRVHWPVWETLYKTVDETVTEVVKNPRRFIP